MIDWDTIATEDRLLNIGRAVVQTDDIDRILAFLERCLTMAHTGHQGGAHLMVGNTNVGKTTGIRLFLLNYASSIGAKVELNVPDLEGKRSPVAIAEYVTLGSGEQLRRPVVRIEIGKNPTFKSLMHDVLYALLRKKPPRFDSYPDMMNTVHQQLYNQQIKLLIFDDVQHVAKARNGLEASEVFKVLAKVTNAEIVLCGLPEETQKIVTSDDQVNFLDLGEISVEALPYPYDENAKFVSFLLGLEQHMPFNTRSPLSDLDLAQRLHTYTQGVPGALKSLLRMAIAYAIDTDYPRVDQKLIGEAIANRLPVSRKATVFTGPKPPPPPRSLSI